MSDNKKYNFIQNSVLRVKLDFVVYFDQNLFILKVPVMYFPETWLVALYRQIEKKNHVLRLCM